MKKPRFNELGVRELTVASEEITCGMVREQRGEGGEPSIFYATPSITIRLDDGRVLTSYAEIELGLE